MVLSIKDIIMALWEKKVLILFSTVFCCAILGIVGMGLEDPLYMAKGSLYVYNEGSRVGYDISAGELSASQQLVSTYIVVLKSNNVLNKVSEELENYELSAAQIRSMMSASAISGTEAFNIIVTSDDRLMAQEVCNTILKVAPEEIIRVVKAGSVEIIDWAEIPKNSTWDLKKYIAGGALLGFAVSAAYVLLRFIYDITIYDETRLMEEFTLPIIGVIPAQEFDNQRNVKNGRKTRGERHAAREKKKRRQRV